VARADTGSGPALMRDVPVAAEDAVDDTADTRGGCGGGVPYPRGAGVLF
jgi:hypothetical protein